MRRLISEHLNLLLEIVILDSDEGTPVLSNMRAAKYDLLTKMSGQEQYQVCAYKDGEVIIDTAAGVLRKYDPRPVQPHSLFPVFSITKVVMCDTRNGLELTMVGDLLCFVLKATRWMLYTEQAPPAWLNFALCGLVEEAGNPTGGLFGTVVAMMGILSTAAYVLTMDMFGPIGDNAGGIVEMSQQPESVWEITDVKEKRADVDIIVLENLKNLPEANHKLLKVFTPAAVGFRKVDILPGT
ncbi:pyrophosphate-energized membrane proton pump 2 [Tanacetum coccineum]